MKKMACGCDSLVEHLASMPEALDSIPSAAKQNETKHKQTRPIAISK